MQVDNGAVASGAKLAVGQTEELKVIKSVHLGSYKKKDQGDGFRCKGIFHQHTFYILVGP